MTTTTQTTPTILDELTLKGVPKAQRLLAELCGATVEGTNVIVAPDGLAELIAGVKDFGPHTSSHRAARCLESRLLKALYSLGVIPEAAAMLDEPDEELAAVKAERRHPLKEHAEKVKRQAGTGRREATRPIVSGWAPDPKHPGLDVGTVVAVGVSLNEARPYVLVPRTGRVLRFGSLTSALDWAIELVLTGVQPEVAVLDRTEGLGFAFRPVVTETSSVVAA